MKDQWRHYALLPVALRSVKQVGDLHAFLGDLHAVSLQTQSTPDAFKVILHPNVPCALSTAHFCLVSSSSSAALCLLPGGSRTHELVEGPVW